MFFVFVFLKYEIIFCFLLISFFLLSYHIRSRNLSRSLSLRSFRMYRWFTGSRPVEQLVDTFCLPFQNCTSLKCRPFFNNHTPQWSPIRYRCLYVTCLRSLYTIALSCHILPSTHSQASPFCRHTRKLNHFQVIALPACPYAHKTVIHTYPLIY